jgi:glycine C-acetyltransferase
MVDEAHSLGVLGATGHGVEEHFNLPLDIIDVKMGVLSKTVPSAGGFIAGSSKLINLLKHNGRGFVYTGSLVPAETGAAIKGLEIIQKEQWRIKKLQENADFFKTELQKRGFNLFNSQTLIVPIFCGSNEKAYNLAKRCWDAKLFVHGIPSPIVPAGTARLRCIVTADHNLDDLAYCVNIIEKAGQAEGII